METQDCQPSTVAAFARVSRAAGVVVALLGFAVLLGWSFDIGLLTDPAQVAPMKPNTAVSFVLLGGALVLAAKDASRTRRTWRKVLGCAAAFLGALSILEYLWRDLGIDQLFFRDVHSSFTPPGRMALLTALSVAALGSALVTIDVRSTRGQRPSEWLAAVALLVALVGSTDYALDWRPELTGIAIHTVGGLLLLGIGVLAARPDDGWMQTLSSEHGGGVAARRLLPFAVCVPLVLGALRWVGQQAGMYGVELGVAIMTGSTVLLLVLAVWWNARQVNRLNEQRLLESKRASAELWHTNRALRAMHNCGQALVHAISEAELLAEICRVVVEDGGYRTAWVGYAEQDENKTVQFVAHHGIAAEYARTARVTWSAESKRGRGPTGTAIRTCQVQVCDDVLTDPRMGPWRESALAEGFRSTAVFPLMAAGSAFGALSIYSAQSRAFQGEEIKLLSRLADDLAYGIVSLRARAERDRVDRELARERQRFSDVLDRLPAYVVLLSPDHTVSFANKYFREHFGESHGRRCYEYLFHRDSPCKVCESFKVLRDHQPRQWEWGGPDGRDYEVHDFPFQDAEGSDLILEMGIDVTERKRAEEKVKQASLYVRNLLEASLDPLVTISKSGRIMDVNHATELVTGYGRERLIGSDFSNYFTDPDKAREGYRQVFAEGSIHDYALSIRHLSGPVTDVLYNATVYRNGAGEIEGVFAAARDITERKRAEESLAQRTAELERSNKELQDFASIASHDLQEPLRKVMAFGDRLRDRAGASLDESGADYLRRMQNAASRMSTLIEALLEYSRVTTKARPFERVNLNTLAREVLSDLETRIQESGARVEVDSLPTLMADKLQMRQLLQNLLANALKFHAPNQPPRVQLTAMRSPDGSWSIAVEDHGVGFDDAYAERIFRPFQRLHGRAEFEGSGMGLAICRKIVDRHRGTISVRSRPGQGTVFTVTLPVNHKEGDNHADVEADYDFDRRGR